MSYSVNLLSTVAECDAILTAKQTERADLVLRLANITNELAKWPDAAAIEAELRGIQSMASGIAPGLGTMPDGDEKRRAGNQLRRFQTKVSNLTAKVENYGIKAKLDKEQDRDAVQASLPVLDALITAVTDRRTALQN